MGGTVGRARLTVLEYIVSPLSPRFAAASPRGMLRAMRGRFSRRPVVSLKCALWETWESHGTWPEKYGSKADELLELVRKIFPHALVLVPQFLPQTVRYPWKAERKGG